VTQGESPEFKLQYCRKKKRKKKDHGVELEHLETALSSFVGLLCVFGKVISFSGLQ
jgi:hypothetical protein